jgi:hypothetical protein
MAIVNRLIAAAAFSTCLAVGAANATVIFTDKNAPQPDEQNILFGSSQTGTNINGATNQSNTPVLFTSTQTLETVGIGQAFLQVSGNTNQNPIPVTDFTFTVPGHTFGDFIFNARFGTGTETVSVVTNDGTFTHDLALGNGENFLTITTAGGETISSVSVSAPGGFDQLQQPRVSGISGVTPPPVSTPEPASIALLGVGLAGIGALRSRRKRQSN